MAYLLISSKIKLEEGPTYCGDEWSDVHIMNHLGAELTHEFGNTYKCYIVSDPPRIVLNTLEKLGFKIVTSTGIGQTIVWTLHRPLNKDILNQTTPGFLTN